MALRKVVALALTSLVVAGAGLTTSASAAPTADNSQSDAAVVATHGCDPGWVCMYPGAGWNGDKPLHFYYDYGTYNLTDMYGTWRIFNNQTGGATMSTCKGYNGTRCEGKLQAGDWIDKYMTPINSITLQP
ncbi:hypothetical protein [Streptomyces sp. NPDC057199]|uniref:hypothetical protein n=1 Tax=Streptomyces sp. NPDC057199 TaxID=3346047 RepID=UPI00362C165F